MFVESLVESTPLLRSHNRTPAVVAFAIQASLVAALLAIPMLHPEMLPTGPIKLSTLVPPLVQTPPPPPAERPHLTTLVSTTPSTPIAPSQTLAEARQQLTSNANGVDVPVLALAAGTGRMDPAMPFSTTGPAAPEVIIRLTPPASPLRISQGVTAGLLLAPIRPVYPQIAELTHTSGTVVVEAIISKSGAIASAHAISGPVILQSSALEAVRTAHYRPYLLNGQPTEVATTISINFRMNE